MAGGSSKRLSSGNPVSPTTDGKCPLCEKPIVHAFRPFCSRHCADLDLHRWMEGRYAIPAEDDENLPEDGVVRH